MFPAVQLLDKLSSVLPPQQVVIVGLEVAAIILITWLTTKLIDSLLHLRRHRRDASRRSALARRTPGIRLAIWALGITLASVPVFQASLAVALALYIPLAVGLGLAAWPLLRNIVAGIVLSIDRQFEEEDTIQVGEHEGEVVSIGLRNVRLRDGRGHLIEVPNAHFLSETTSNVTPNTTDAQVKISMVLPETTEAALARKVAYTASVVSRFASPSHAPEVFVNTEGTEDLLTHLTIRGYVFDPAFEDHYRSDVVELIREGLGISVRPGQAPLLPNAATEMAILK